MSNTATNVSTGKPKIGGAVYYAPLNTALPTDATTDLSDAFKAVGYVSNDGIVNQNGITSDSYKAWGGDTVLSMMTDRADNFQFTCIEALNPNVLAASYGEANVTGDLATGITVKASTVEPGAHVWVIDMALRNNVKKRIVIPNGELSATGDITYKDDDIIGYQLTIMAIPDDSDYTHYEYIKQVAATGGGD